MIITYTLPPNAPKKFQSESDIIIFGRNPRDNQQIDLDLSPDGYVSHVHARLTYEDGEYWIEDLQSENGTWVNEIKITGKTRLTYNAKIKLGWTIIDVERTPVLFHKINEPPVNDSNNIVVNEIEGIDPLINIIENNKKPFLKIEGDTASESDVTIIRECDDSIPDLDKAIYETTETNYNPAREGSITSVKDASPPSFTTAEEKSANDTQKQTWLKLKALNDFIQALETDTTLEKLGKILVDQLRKAIPNAQRGALLLPDQNEDLLLKAHWPEGNHSVSMTFVKRAFIRGEAFIWNASKPSDSIIDEAPHSAIYYDVQSAVYLPLLSAGQILGVMYVDNYLFREAFSPTDFELLRAISNQVAMFIKDHVLRQDLQKEEVMRSNLLRQYSPKVADRILKKCGSIQRGGEKIDPVTILVSDVRGFTALSAGMDPDEVVRAINEMFDAFVPIISDLDGIVDKYIGDSVLAVFGSPEHDPNQWEKAVQAAIKIQRAMSMLEEGRKIRRMPVFRVGIGIHTGEVIHGFIGSSERIEFTVIGDTVNRAARYCDGAGPGEIIISNKVYERVYQKVEVAPKTIITKHPEREPDLEAFLVKGIKDKSLSWDQIV